MKNPKEGQINWGILEDLVGERNVQQIRVEAIEGYLTQESEASLREWQKILVDRMLDELRKAIDQVIEA